MRGITDQIPGEYFQYFAVGLAQSDRLLELLLTSLSESPPNISISISDFDWLVVGLSVLLLRHLLPDPLAGRPAL